MTSGETPARGRLLPFPPGGRGQRTADADAFLFLSVFGAMNFVGIGENVADPPDLVAAD